MAHVNEQAKALLGKPKAERVEFLKNAFRYDPKGAYGLGVRLELTAKEALEIMNETMKYANASTVQWWMEFYATISGVRRLLKFLEHLNLNGGNGLYDIAMYWLPCLSSIRTEQDTTMVKNWISSLNGHG